MEHHKALRILQLLLSGYPVKLEDRVWYLGANNMLGLKLDKYVDGVKQQSNDEINCVE